MSSKYKDASDASRNRLLEIRTRLERINLEKQEVDRQREQLRAEALSLLRVYKPIEEDLLKEVEIYSEAWGRSFGTMLQAFLPREIRDLIYAELIVFNTPVKIPNYMNFWGDWGLNMKRQAKYESRTKEIVDRCKPFVSPEFLGAEVSQEIIQAFYEKNLFHLSKIEDLEFFLTTDLFSDGCLPSYWVRNLRIMVDENVFFNRWDWSPSDPSDKQPFAPNSTRLALFDHLGLIRNKPGFELILQIPTSRRHVTHQLVYGIGTTVFQLRDQGFKVKVTHGKTKGKRTSKSILNSSDKVYPWPGTDWTFLFDGDREDWYRKAEKKELHIEILGDSE